MYKTKVWIHKSKEDIITNQGDFWLNCTFIDKPLDDYIVTITEDLILDIQDEIIWNEYYGPGEYKVFKASEMFNPEQNDGFSYCVMVYKVQ
ncbi:hypothetical protein GTQ34_15835 [Muricauda sp. JGD-17]|uniref:Uncharacterized protein n=1 Tax=Flagellimonas ochracea TaxID=2696472 RepID=A0A964TFD9_9FLAO|nr:hypothetical protein [Allomuricauda ochracea]NAY93381.1 hypothetical protein [Allomuricauda ochracea]